MARKTSITNELLKRLIAEQEERRAKCAAAGRIGGAKVTQAKLDALARARDAKAKKANDGK